MTMTPAYDPFGIRPALSTREIEVLLAWFESDSKTEAGKRLFISQGTINTHLSRIREKYAAVGRPAPTKAALVARALQDALVDIDDL
ncbi:LuxR C-terminal-related transcriptional regulator [Nocardia asteroides]|uniref:LuxR C-terminal-related transcriptional regulator n=1 Tax=Nocardia asteroides TaxID=1824 RepID=UPI001E33838E|nr:LuxR C-terminal-related transcriptional regulator [Nocardia asteroides]UGT60541.1 LuxR C-terminal-related transcriptional regulator [Nocardia asteroides]